MKNRSFNFGAGPAALPESILLEAQSELLNWQGRGLSILEIGHRTPDFMQMMNEAEIMLREILLIPDNYHVLFLSGPARLQFAMLPLNLLKKDQAAGFLISGVWSEFAYEECVKLKQAYCVASSKSNNFNEAPKSIDWQLRDNTGYVYYTSNETVNGVRYPSTPQFGDIPVVADMTSCILSEVINVSDYGVIFAGSQKNIAPAGLTVVIINKDLLHSNHQPPIPTILDYNTHVVNHSLYATPVTFSCYMAWKMFKWVKEQGGVGALQILSQQKSDKLYAYIDSSDFYECKISKTSRSLMNVCFSINKPKLEPIFLEHAVKAGLIGLKGHKLVGGIRASLYNAMPMAGVDALIEFMQNFKKLYLI
jgi:phosphoserine aminotransferase